MLPTLFLVVGGSDPKTWLRKVQKLVTAVFPNPGPLTWRRALLISHFLLKSGDAMTIFYWTRLQIFSLALLQRSALKVNFKLPRENHAEF